MQKKKIVVVDYQPIWAQQFEEMKTLFQQHLGASFVSIEHVGSTSVVGLAAKPILDIDIVVIDDDMVAKVIEKLALLGYQHVGDQGVSGREVVKLRNEEAPLYHMVQSWPRHHLYICKQGAASLQNHLQLRDYLRTHPEKVAEYGALKKKLAKQFPEDIDAYIDGKTPLITSILKASGFAREDLLDIEQANRMPTDI